MSHIVRIPSERSVPELLSFGTQLATLPPSDRFLFDFEAVEFVTPAWMVLVGNAIRDFKQSRPASKRKALNYKHLSYAAHAGFFRYLGVDFGLPVGEAPLSDTFIPLTERRVTDIHAASAARYSHPGDIIQGEADDLSYVLTRTTHGALFDTIAYSVRELVRNVIEHSQSASYTFAAQYWPARNVAEIVVSDSGIGLAASLRARYPIEEDAEAITLATKAGVSSKAPSTSNYDHWANSGYGLFMTKELCRATGYFAIASGTSGATWQGDTLSTTECAVAGTTVAMSLNTSRLDALSDRLRTLATLADREATAPSSASLSVRR